MPFPYYRLDGGYYRPPEFRIYNLSFSINTL